MELECVSQVGPVQMLKRHRIVPTSQRVAIARILFSCPQHISIDELRERMARARVRASKPTLYNTLNLFVRRGLIREIVVDPTRRVYDTNPGKHHHLYNVDTGELVDIDMDKVTVHGLPGCDIAEDCGLLDVVIRVRGTAG